MFGKTRRKIALFSIPVLGSLSIIGTGFCLWTFEDSVPAPVEVSMPVKVSGEVKNGVWNADSLSIKGEIETAEKGYLFPRMLVFGEGSGYSKDLTKGLNFYKKIDNSVAKPGLPVFVDQPFLANTTTVTYYRPNLLSMDELHADGKDLSLKVKIGITKELSEIITILDSFHAVHTEVVEPDIGDSLKTTTVHYYTYDYTDEITSTPVTTLYNEKKGIDIPTYPSLSNKAKSKKYQVFSYHMSFQKIFRYISLDTKPITLDNYVALYNKLKDPTLPQQYLSFQFSAEIVPYTPVLGA